MPEHQQQQTQTTDQTRNTSRQQGQDADPRARDAQADHVRGLASPAQKARSALRNAGLPLDHMIPESAKAFDQQPDGSFTLQLAGDVRHKIGDVTLVLTSKISGKLGSGTLTNVSGIYGEKKVAFITGKGNVQTVTRAGDELVITTDHSMAKEIRLKVADVKAVG
jgi:hypothetical protein